MKTAKRKPNVRDNPPSQETRNRMAEFFLKHTVPLILAEEKKKEKQ